MDMKRKKTPTIIENKCASENAKLKIFNIIQTQYSVLGISRASNQTTDNRVLRGFLLFVWLFISHFAYTFHVANEFMEYVQGVCTTSASAIAFVCFTSRVFTKTTLFESIDSIEKIIETSEPIFKLFSLTSVDKYVELNENFL